MKKTTIFTILLAATFNLAAQDAFYYIGSEKSPLTKVPGKEVAIYKTLDSQGRIDFVQISLEDRLTVNTSIGEFLARTECYVDYTGLEVTPTGYFYIKLKHSDDFPILCQIAEQYELEIVKHDRYMPLWYTLRIISKIESTIIDISNSIYETGLFASCSPAFAINAEELSYDPEVNQQWGLFNVEYPMADISISEAWSFATGRGVKIAFIDSGADLDHQDLKDNILMSYDFHADTAKAEYYSDHGTFCAGVAAAKRNNGKNITGVAPDAKIMMGIVHTVSHDLYEYEVANAINWAWQNGADIISCSINCSDKIYVREAIDNAMSNGRNGKGSIFVKSAGNNGIITFPGTYRNDIIVVGAIEANGEIWEDSGVGSNMFICAPGVDVLSLSPDNQMMLGTGTSAACPHVSGVIALMLERNPNLTINQVREILAETAVKIGNVDYNLQGEFGLRNNYYGYGLVNAHQAVINTPKN